MFVNLRFFVYYLWIIMQKYRHCYIFFYLISSQQEGKVYGKFNTKRNESNELISDTTNSFVCNHIFTTIFKLLKYPPKLKNRTLSKKLISKKNKKQNFFLE